MPALVQDRLPSEAFSASAVWCALSSGTEAASVNANQHVRIPCSRSCLSRLAWKKWE